MGLSIIYQSIISIIDYTYNTDIFDLYNTCEVS